MSSLDVFTQNPNTLFLIWNKIDGQPEKEFIPHLSIYTVATCSATAAEGRVTCRVGTMEGGG